MNVSRNKKWLVEIISWTFAAIACLLVLAPILFTIQEYPFLTINIISIFVALFYTRLIFLKPLIPFGNTQLFMLIIVFTTIPIAFLLIENLFIVQGYINNVGIYSFLKTLPENKILSLSKYIKFEITFFSTWAIIVTIIAPFVMIKSIYRKHKINQNYPN